MVLSVSVIILLGFFHCIRTNYLLFIYLTLSELAIQKPPRTSVQRENSAVVNHHPKQQKQMHQFLCVSDRKYASRSSDSAATKDGAYP